MSYVGIFSILGDFGIAGVAVRDVASTAPRNGLNSNEMHPFRIGVEVAASVRHIPYATIVRDRLQIGSNSSLLWHVSQSDDHSLFAEMDFEIVNYG